MRRITSRIRKSFSAKIIILVITNVFVTSMVIGIVTMRSTEDFLTTKVSEKFPSVLRNTRAKIEIWYAKRSLDVAIIARSDVFLHSLDMCLQDENDQDLGSAKNEIAGYFHYVKEQFPVYEELAVVDRRGNLIVGTSDDVLEEASLLKSLAQENVGETVLSEAILNSGSNEIYQWLLVPIDATEELKGAVCARLELKKLEKLLAEVPLGPAGDLYILDFRGKFVTQPRTRSENMLGVKAMEVPTRQDKPMTVERYNNYSGDRVLGSKVILPDWRWWLVCEEDYHTAMAPVLTTRYRIIMADLFILAIFIMAALRVVRPILRPIRALAVGAKKIKEGMVGVKIKAASDDEIGLMIHTFNEMAQEISMGRVKLQAKNKELNSRNEELQVLNVRLEELSVTDGLTGLFNHRHFWNLLHNELSRADRSKGDLAIILLDIDDFKMVNDQFGHPVGDVLLQSFADAVRESVRETDIVARYGGEEFAIMLPNTERNGAMRVAEKIRQSIEQMNFKVPDTDVTISVTASIGVSIYQGNRRELFKAVDQALYVSKNKGKNCVSFAECT
jgi:diguanylate cyclase (GGDEF)-like protein